MRGLVFSGLFLVVLSVFVVSGACQEVTVGVAEGDHFVYDCFIDGDVDLLLAFLEFDEFFQLWNETDWERREVTAVDGAVIEFNVTTGYSNGTVANRTVDFNVTSSHDFWVIGSGLEAGGYVGTLELGDDLYVDETVQWTYESETRDTNMASWVEAWSDRTMWWDKQTGVLVKEGVSFGAYNLDTGEEDYVNAWRVITDTNHWTVPEYPTQTTILLMLVLATATIAVYKHRKTKR